MLEYLQLGHIVLSRLAVHFPVDIDTTLVLGEWVIVEQGVACHSLLALWLFCANGCQLAQGGLGQDVPGGYVQSQLVVDHGAEAHGNQRTESGTDQIGGDTKVLMFQCTGCQVKELLLQCCLGSHDVFGMHLWHGECTAVHLTIRQTRHLVQLGVVVRSHIVCQCTLFHELAHLFRTYGLALYRSIVEADVFVAIEVYDLDCRHVDVLHLTDYGFNLAQLDAVSTYLDLTVNTTEILQYTLVGPAHQVARVVHAYLTAPMILTDKGTVDKDLCCLLWQSPVACAYLNTGKAQFASHTARQ